jgi:hypothetical protein
MTYYKYSHFLMQKDGPEYGTTLKAGTAAPFFLESIIAKLAAAASLRFARSHCRHKSIIPHGPAQASVRRRLAVRSHYS